jgi:5-methylthioribose kinase
MKENPALDGSKTASLKAYFSGLLGTEVQAVGQLKGGRLNDVYSVQTDHESFVAKSFPSKARSGDFSGLPENRYEVEKSAMTSLSGIVRARITPRAIRFDDAGKTIVMEDLGQENRLDRKFEAMTPEDVSGMGRLLAQIANATYGKEELSAQFDSAELQRLKMHHRYYKNVVNPDVFPVRDRLMEAIGSGRKSLTHCDTRFNNIFWRGGEFTLIDFEGLCFSDVALDISYFLSELLIHHYNRPSPKTAAMVRETWAAYKDALAIPEDVRALEARIVRHVGFSLIGKIKGIIVSGPDYDFVADKPAMLARADRIILDPGLMAIDALPDVA